MCMAYTDFIHVRVRDFGATVGPEVKNSPGPILTVFSGPLFFPHRDLQMCSRGCSCFQSQVDSVSS